MNVPLSPVRCLDRARGVFGKQQGVVDGDARFTFAEFADRAQRLAGALIKMGLRPGEPVAFLCPNSHPLLEAYFGIPLAGGLIMPLNIRLAPPEIAAILQHSGARYLFFSPQFDALASSLTVPHKFQIGPAFENLLGASSPQPIHLSTIDENAGASLFYTSGTSGTPKGVVHSHRALYLHALSVALTFHIDNFTVELYTVPLFHANGWGRPHAAMLMGARQILMPSFSSPHVIKLIEQERVTSFCLVPAMAEQLLSASEPDTADLSSVAEIHVGGSAVSATLTARLTARFDCHVTAGYGMTETGPVATTGRPKRDSATKLNEAGWPVPGASVEVESSSGEVLLSGDHLLSGYWGDAPRDTEWIQTGDIGWLDPDDQLVILDRKKDMIISGGENISSIEVEAALARHPAVAECAVVAAPDATWGEVPLAYVVLQSPATGPELAAWLTGRIARFKIPKLWQFLSGPLPRTATGKISKRNLGSYQRPIIG